MFTMQLNFVAEQGNFALPSPDIAHVKNSRNETFLHVAAGYGISEVVSYLVKCGANVNARDIKGQTPLHNASNHCHKYTSIFLIKSSADVNAVDLMGWSALHFAVSKFKVAKDNIEKHWQLIEALILCGADPSLETKSGKSCTYRIRDSEESLLRIKVLRLVYKATQVDDVDEFRNIMHELSKHPISRTMINKPHPLYGKTSLEHILSKPHLIQMMLDQYKELGIDIQKHIKEYFDLLDDANLQAFKQKTTKYLLNSRLTSKDNVTPLHRAAGYNHLEIAKFLIQSGADVDAEDAHGLIPLHYAANFGHADIVQLLVDSNSDINKKDNSGMTPLHLAAVSVESCFMICDKLINLGADKNARNSCGERPYDIAEKGLRQVLNPNPLSDVEVIPSSSCQAVYLSRNEVSINCDLRLLDLHQYGSFSEDQFLMLDSRSNERLISNIKRDIKIIKLGETDKEFHLIKERMFSTIREHNGELCGRFSSYDIISIERILNQVAWTNYKMECEKLRQINHGDANERLLFHGSTKSDFIVVQGFDERLASPDNMFGAGIYFAKHSSKSNQYTFPFRKGCDEHQDKTCFKCVRKMIYSQVALGKSLEVKAALQTAHAPPGYNSVTAVPEITTNLSFPECVIYRGEQAYPLYRITYRIVP